MKFFWYIVSGLAFLLCLVLITSASANTAQAPYTVALPLLTGQPQSTVFGLETSSLSSARGIETLAALEPTWTRRNALRWSDVEPVEGGGYQWDAPRVQALEQEMIQANQRGLRLILIVQHSPRWATAPYNADCAPIAPTKQPAYAAFLQVAVERYSKPPFNVHYWELGNEPDAYVFASDSVYGCWGLEDDEYYGGREYGAMLNVVYPAMKAANPAITVLNGGLLLDRPYDPTTDTGRSGRFFEGMLVAGAGASFDVLSYHSYVFYTDDPDGHIGPVDWKPGYLRQMMQAYGIDKPLFNTEGALLCTVATPQCQQAQSDAIGRYYTRAIRDELVGFVWYIYDSDAFRNTALIDPRNVSQVRPSYRAYQHASHMLRGVTYIGATANTPEGVESYTFRRGDETLIVLWSDAPQPIAVALGTTNAATCTAWDGTPIACMGADGTITVEAASGPTYVVYIDS